MANFATTFRAQEQDSKENLLITMAQALNALSLSSLGTFLSEDNLTRLKAIFLLMYLDPRYISILQLLNEALVVPLAENIICDWLV